MQPSPRHHHQDLPWADPAARAVAAVGLGALALIHVVDLPDTITASPLVGWEYLALIAACVVVAAGLLTRPTARQWGATLAIAVSALVAYTLSRTTGIPGDSADIGNWRCPLGTAALTVEGLTLAVAAGVLGNVVAWQRLPIRARVLGARVPAGIVEATQTELEVAP